MNGEKPNGPLRAAIDALRSQPLSLALVMMNLALLVFLFSMTSTATRERENFYNSMNEMQRDVQQLLSKCVVPEPGSLK